MAGTIDQASELFADAVGALRIVGGDVRAAAQLLALLGWALPPGISDIGLTQMDLSALLDAIEALEDLRNGPDGSDAQIAAAVAELVLALRNTIESVDKLIAGFEASSEYLDATQIKSQFFVRLGDLLVIHLVGSAAMSLS